MRWHHVPSTPVRAWRTIPALLLVLTACNSVHEARVTADGQRVAELPAIPYRVEVVAHGEVLNGPQDTTKLHFVFGTEAFRQRVERTLRDDCALATTVSVGSGDNGSPADLRLSLSVVQRPEMAYEGTTSGNVAAIGLWLFTIFGGSFVDDCRYRVRIPVDCDLIDPSNGAVLYRFTADTGYVDTEYWDRVTVPGGLLWALSCVPHCLVSDNVEVTSHSLSAKGTELLAFAIAKHLKGSFEGAAAGRLGRIEIAAPSNGARMAARDLHLDFTVRTEDPLRGLEVRLGSRQELPLLQCSEVDLRQRSRREGRDHVVRIQEHLDVLEHPSFRRHGDNFLHVRIQAGSIDAWRTLRLVLD